MSRPTPLPLASLARALAARKALVERANANRGITVTPQRPPVGLAVKYADALVDVVERVHRKILDAISGHLVRAQAEEEGTIRRDGIGEILIGQILEEIALAYETRVDPNELTGQLSLDFGTQIAAHNKRELDRQLRAIFGVAMPESKTPIGQALEGFRTANVGLVTNMLDEQRARITSTLVAAASSGKSVREIRDELEGAVGVSRSRATLIARDQTLKFNAQLTQMRHAEVGIDEYQWSTSHDERVRGDPSGEWPATNGRGGDHWSLQGKIFRYSDPPVVDHSTGRRANPGEDYQCRCVAVPVIRAGGETFKALKDAGRAPSIPGGSQAIPQGSTAAQPRAAFAPFTPQPSTVARAVTMPPLDATAPPVHAAGPASGNFFGRGSAITPPSAPSARTARPTREQMESITRAVMSAASASGETSSSVLAAASRKLSRTVASGTIEEHLAAAHEAIAAERARHAAQLAAASRRAELETAARRTPEQRRAAFKIVPDPTDRG